MPGTRMHFLDVARTCLLCFIFLYHAGLIYGTTAWAIVSPDQSFTALATAHFVSGMRLPGFFLIAGYFTRFDALTSGTSCRKWLHQRAQRLLLPAFVTILTLNWLQVLINTWALPGLSLQQRHEAFLRIATTPQSWIAHTWFLFALFEMTVIGLGLWLLAGKIQNTALAGHCRRLASATGQLLRFLPEGSWILLYALAAALWAYLEITFVWKGGIPSTPFFGLLRLREILQYAPWFALGYLLQKRTDLRDSFFSWHWLPLLAALGAAYLHLRVLSDAVPFGPMRYAMVTPFGVFGCYLMLATFRSLFDRDTTLSRVGVELAMVIYLVHQPVLKLLGLAMLRVNWPPTLEWLLVAFGALGISYFLARAINGIPVLFYLFNGTRRRA